MKKKDVFGFVVLPAGVILALAGFRFASLGDARGWAGIVAGIALVVVALRAVRAAPAEPPR